MFGLGLGELELIAALGACAVLSDRSAWKVDYPAFVAPVRPYLPDPVLGGWLLVMLCLAAARWL